MSTALCFGAIAIGIIALIGYVLGNASIASLSTNGKPVGAVTALAFIVLGAGLLALRSPTPTGVSTARRAALGVIVLAAADLLSGALSPHIEEWQMWAARGGVNLHAFPITGFLLLASGSAFVFVTTRRDFAGHLIASAVLLICVVFLFAYVLKVPTFIDPFKRVAPVVATTFGLALISVAELLARPRGWVVPLLSRTPAGTMSRLLLPAAFIVPSFALALRDLDDRWFVPEAELTVFVVLHAFFGAAIVLSVGVILLKRERDRALLASIVDSSSDAIIGTSVTGVIESWNTGAERMYGYTAAEAIGRPIAMLAALPERHDEVPLLIERSRRGEQVDPLETVGVTKDGRRIDVWLSVSTILDSEGRVVGASTITHDISDRVRADAALRTSEERLRVGLNTANIAVFNQDLDLRYVWMSQPQLGYTSAQVVGSTDADLLPPEAARNVTEIKRRVLESGLKEHAEVPVSVGGQTFVYDLVVEPLREASGAIIGLTGASRDITERVRAEEVIRRMADEHATMLATSADGFWRVDFEGRLLDVNDAYCRMSGYSREELLELSIGDIEAIETPEETASHIRSVVESGFDRFETRHRTKDNRILDIEGTVSLLRTTGQMLVFVRDITQQKQKQEALQRSEERLQLAQRAAGIGHFSSDIQNNIMTPSDELLALYGLSPGSFGGTYESWRALMFPGDLPAVDAEMKKSLTSGEFSCDFRVVWPDASIHWLHSRARVFFSDDGKPLRTLGANMDITERMRTEQALRDSEAALAEAQQIARIGSWILYPESGELRASAETFRIFALDPLPVVPVQLLLERVHEEDRAGVEAGIAVSLQTGTLDLEFRIVTPQGTRVAHAIARQREAGEPRLSLIGATQDITEWKAGEGALQQHSESLERSNLELERFNRLAVGRELRMIELKQQINDLCAQLGQPAPYVLPEAHALAKETS